MMYKDLPQKPRFDKNETTEIKLKFDSMFPGHKWTVLTWKTIYPELAKYPQDIQEEGLFILLNSNLKFPPSPSQYIGACKDAYAKFVGTNPDALTEKEDEDLPNHSQTEHAKIHGFNSFNELIIALNSGGYDYWGQHIKLMADNRTGYITKLKEIRYEDTKNT